MISVVRREIAALNKKEFCFQYIISTTLFKTEISLPKYVGLRRSDREGSKPRNKDNILYRALQNVVLK